MFSLRNFGFLNSKKAEPKEKKEKNHFSIEHYPLTCRFYPKYKDHYIGKDYNTGIYTLKQDYLFMYAKYSDTVSGAEQIIEMFKEQQLKENVKTIKYEPKK